MSHAGFVIPACVSNFSKPRGLWRAVLMTALRPLGLTNGQFSLLMSLNRPEAASIGDVSAVLAMDRTTLTANLKPLRRRGPVAISVDGADKRSRRLRLTPAGRALLVAALPVWESEHAAIEALLTGVDPDRLRGNLRMLY